MNLLKLKIVNPLGLHARASAHVTQVGNIFFPDAEIVVVRSSPGPAERFQFCHHEANAKSIMGVMALCAPFGAEVEFISFMPRELWALYAKALLGLHFTATANSRSHAYKRIDSIDESPAVGIENFLSALYASRALPDSRPFFKYIEGSVAEDELLVPSDEPVTAAPPPQIDVFVSVNSRDTVHARNLHRCLERVNIRAFVADRSIAAEGDSDFQRTIEASLDAARHLAVIASCPENVEGGWVRAEWSTFLNEVRFGRKRGNIVSVLADGMTVDRLPIALRPYQTLPLQTIQDEALISYFRTA